MFFSVLFLCSICFSHACAEEIIATMHAYIVNVSDYNNAKNILKHASIDKLYIPNTIELEGYQDRRYQAVEDINIEQPFLYVKTIHHE